MRGSNEFITMKGFMEGDFVNKGDVTDKAKVEEAVSAKESKKGDKEGTTHMAEDASYVEEAADGDITDGYVSDAQGEKVGKGWEAYNEKCASGIVVKDYGMTRDNIGMVIKGMEDSIVTKARKKKTLVLDPSDTTIPGAKEYGDSVTEKLKEQQRLQRIADEQKKFGESVTATLKDRNKPTMMDGVKNTATKVKDSVSSAATGAKDAVTDTAKNIWGKLGPKGQTAAKVGGTIAAGTGVAYGGKKLYDKYSAPVEKGFQDTEKKSNGDC